MTEFTVRSHLVETWGNPIREAEFKKGDLVIGVLKWKASPITQGVNLYATIGSSDHAVPGFDLAHRQEFFVGFLPECDEFASALARLGIYGQLSGRGISPGDTYRSQHGLIEGSGFSGFAVLTPLNGVPLPLALPDGRHVEFLMAMPLYDKELDFASSHGTESLLAEMEAREVAFWNPQRSSTFKDGD